MAIKVFSTLVDCFRIAECNSNDEIVRTEDLGLKLWVPVSSALGLMSGALKVGLILAPTTRYETRVPDVCSLSELLTACEALGMKEDK